MAGPTKARVARASRIWVEGVHDAALLEHVWGEDLRYVGVVVEPLHGADDLAGMVRAFRPGPTRRLGVLLDHLVPGSKESRIAAQVDHPDVLVLGHPEVDIFTAVDPRLAGLTAWPDVPMGQDFKSAVARHAGWAGDVPAFWRQLVGRVTALRDLDRTLVRNVEQLIDFVTVEDDGT